MIKDLIDRLKLFWQTHPEKRSFFITLLLLISLPFTVFLALQVQQLRQRASQSDVVRFTDANGIPLPSKITDPNVYLYITLPNDWKVEESSSKNPLVQNVYAQPACREERKICGQPAYGNCTLHCDNGKAFYDCVQTDNPNCIGKNIGASCEDYKCQQASTPTPTGKPTPTRVPTSTKPVSQSAVCTSLTLSPSRVERGGIVDLTAVYNGNPSNIKIWVADNSNVGTTDVNQVASWTEAISDSISGGGVKTMRLPTEQFVDGLHLVTAQLLDGNENVLDEKRCNTMLTIGTGSLPQAPPLIGTTQPLSAEGPTTPPQKILKSLTIENNGPSNAGGDNPRTITTNLISILAKPVPWKLNPLPLTEIEDQIELTREVEVTLSDGRINAVYIASIVLTKPTLSPTPTSIPIPESENQPKQVDILTLHYLRPDIPDLAFRKNKINSLNIILADFLTRASKYHGYKNRNTQPALTHKIVVEKEFLQGLPPSGDRTQVFLADYRKVLNDIDICNMVDNGGIDQVWIWSDHKDTNIDESNMSMGTDSRAFWNFPDYGDISNSRRINDMPTCKRTYVLFNFNYDRFVGEMFESFGHQTEAVLRWVDFDLFWNRFVNPHGDTNAVNSCGWIHSPPNVTDGNQYDWVNERTVKSDCEDWKPEGEGEIKDTSCHTWYQYRVGVTCPRDASGFATEGGMDYKIWWMQNLPGMNNSLSYNDKPLRNWWVFMGDFDTAIASGRSLVQSVNAKKITIQSAGDQARNPDANYVPPASLSHPSYAPSNKNDDTYQAIIHCFNKSISTDPSCSPGDLTGDGVVDVFDYNRYVERTVAP